MTQGDLLKEAGLTSVENNNKAWVERMRAWARHISTHQGSVTIDDLRRTADNTNDHPAHPNAWGAIFKPKEWVCVGRVKSTYTSNHGREIKVWKYQPEGE